MTYNLTKFTRYDYVKLEHSTLLRRLLVKVSTNAYQIFYKCKYVSLKQCALKSR